MVVLALLGAGIALALHLTDPAVRAFAMLEDGRKEEARQLLDAVPDEKRKPSWSWARAAVHHAQGQHVREAALLSKLNDADRSKVEERVLDGLAEDYGQGIELVTKKLLERLPETPVRSRFEELAEEPFSPRQWGALRYLDQLEAVKDADLVDGYIAALESKDCDIRGRAAERLGEIGDRDAVPALKRVREQPKKPGLFGAGDCGHKAAGVALQQLGKDS